MLDSIPSECPVIVVDNSANNNIDSLSQNDSIKIIKLNENKGYGVACNIAAKQVDTPYILFLNPDTLFYKDTLTKLLEAVESYPQAVAFNPKIQSASGKQEFKKRSVLLSSKANAVTSKLPKQDLVVPFLAGSIMLVDRASFEKIGGFDEAIFLYHEDDDISIRLSKIGDIMYIDKSVATHLQGNSSARSPEIAALKAYHMGRSRIYALRKHNRPHAFIRSLGLAFMRALSPDMLFSKRRRAKVFAFMRGIWSMR